MKRVNKSRKSGRNTLLAAAVMGAVAPMVRAGATTGFSQTGAGPYDYNAASNWVGSTINGTWDTSLTLTAAQTVTFAATPATNPILNFNYAGAFNLTLDSSSTTTE